MIDPKPISHEEYVAFDEHLEQLVTTAAGLDEWKQLDLLMHEAASAPHPYLVHSYAAVCMLRVMTDETRDEREEVLASNLYLVWNGFGDWYEMTGKALERAEAEASLRLSANEWLALPDDIRAREAFAARWQESLHG
jgi:hypothetical protein